LDGAILSKAPDILVLGISGGSGAGKTVLANALVQMFTQVCLLDLDSYYLDRRDLSPEARRHLNFDEPAAIDVRLLLRHLTHLRKGAEITKPIYSFATHSRVGASHVSPAPLVIIEGLHVLWWPTLRRHFDVKVYVDCPADIRLLRRIDRDTRERGRSAKSILDQHIATVRPMHDKYVEPCRQHADVIVTSDPLERALTMIAARLRQLGFTALSQISPPL
jgi:uridine kinase